MTPSKILHKRARNLLGGAAAIALLAGPAAAQTQEQKTQLDIPAQPLATALKVFSVESDSQVLFNDAVVAGRSSPPLKGAYSRVEALALLLKGTDLRAEQSIDHVYLIKPAEQHSEVAPEARTRLAEATPARAAASVETVVVTSSKIKGDIQTVPIAITALSQEQLTSRQIAGGPDLVKEVPNLTFTKTNFSGYSIQIRGIGTQAISVSTDPAVAVALNDIPFIRNHFFEQEFFDVNQVEVLRGPQGTLYGRNATAGVVNVISAKPTDQFEAMASADIGNYHNRRFEGMVNIPVVDDRLDLRIAGEWTKRDGYTTDTTLNSPIDGRDLWSTRVTLGWKPSSNLQTELVWEHFNENDDRLRSGKQLCETAPPATSVNGVAVPHIGADPGDVGHGIAVGGAGALVLDQNYTSQSCQATSLYSPTAFQVPFGPSLPFIVGLDAVGGGNAGIDPYAETTQSTNLRNIQSTLLPTYRAKNDTLEFNAVYNISPVLTLTSDTGYNQDFLWSSEDYNRFDTAPGLFARPATAGGAQGSRFLPDPAAGTNGIPSSAVIFCDPQLGCSDRIVAEDLDEEHAWQLSQEFRLASNFGGPLNFSVGGNYLHYETEEKYYVFINALSLYTASGWEDSFGTVAGSLDNSDCLPAEGGYQARNPILGGGAALQGCVYMDPNPISSLNDKGHNYFLSQNPYTLNSYAGFGELYYDIAQDLKLTGGLRWTVDEKHFVNIPSQVVADGYGYFITGALNQKWERPTGRVVLDWTPKLDFTDQTLVYASYSHGYKAGGANPPGAVFLNFNGNVANTGTNEFPVHPLTFKPEYIDAYELGTKNTLLDGGLTLNGDVFYYDYKNYQISKIVDRTAINDNYNARVMGSEITADWEPSPGLKFAFAGGYEDTRINNGQFAIDLMDRTAGMPGWMVLKPFVTTASNCILPDYVVAALLQEQTTGINGYIAGVGPFACGVAYNNHLDPATDASYKAYPTGLVPPLTSINDPAPIPAGYPGFNPDTPAYNDGEGFAKPLGGNQLPNAPHFTTSLTADYTLPVSEDWAATLHSDFYWQSQSMARVFNDRPYDKIRGYSTTNLALILTSASGWQVMGYLKNVFNVTAITGDFLNSDDSGLTTNVFLTDPRLYGVRITKNW